MISSELDERCTCSRYVSEVLYMCVSVPPLMILGTLGRYTHPCFVGNLFFFRCLHILKAARRAKRANLRRAAPHSGRARGAQRRQRRARRCSGRARGVARRAQRAAKRPRRRRAARQALAARAPPPRPPQWSAQRSAAPQSGHTASPDLRRASGALVRRTYSTAR